MFHAPARHAVLHLYVALAWAIAGDEPAMAETQVFQDDGGAELSLLQTRAHVVPHMAGDGPVREDGPIHKVSAVQTGAERSKPPHVLFILVDDLGWGDVGFNLKRPNREVQTENMDRLVKEGVHLMRHYVHSECAGTRVSCQSGRLPVHSQSLNLNVEDPTAGMPRNMTGMAEKLSAGGYKTHFVGKWDVGMATHHHTPRGRGYSTSLGYFEHDNDYWTQSCTHSACCLGDVEYGGPNGEQPHITDLWLDDGPAMGLNGTDYEEFIFLRRMEEIIRNHDPEEPLFLFYAPHVAHCPLQVPKKYMDKFSFMGDDTSLCRFGRNKTDAPNVLRLGEDAPDARYRCRMQYRAAVNLLDDIIGNLVDSLRKKDMWEDTLLIFTSDNGGPLDSGTNHPLRGAKGSKFEGGVRAAAFLSGGFIPPLQRGKTLKEILHISDWYATLVSLAGVAVEDERAAASGLPPVDGLNMWPIISGEAEVGPRTELPLSELALIQGRYKFLTGMQKSAVWLGRNSVNKTHTSINDVVLDCTGGCLYDLEADETEHDNIAAQRPEIAEVMKARLLELSEGFYVVPEADSNADSCPPGIGMPCACWMAVNYYGGFLGPFQEVDTAAKPWEKSRHTPPMTPQVL